MISLVDPLSAEAGEDLVARVKEIFSSSGLLSKASNFEYRPQQQEMAVAVAEALENGSHLAVEAGTGVGKSLAYLIPSILFAVKNNRKAVISTHTINLQEQLTQKDLPMLAAVLPEKFSFAMLKGRGNYLCTRRLHRAMQQADGLFTSPESKELQRIYEWSKVSEDGSLSDFEVEPNANVWSHVCSERGLCSPKLCGFPSDFARDHPVCFFQRVRHRILSADVLVVNHTLFFTLLGTTADSDHGILFKNDFVIFDEAHTVENVASRYVGLRVSSGQLRFALNRLWNQNTGKGLLGSIREQRSLGLVQDLLLKSDQFFQTVEQECDTIFHERVNKDRTAPWNWSELRIRQADLVEDTVTLPIERLREAISDLIKRSDDKQVGQELQECNRRLIELREALALFLSQSAAGHVYWVERAGKLQRNLVLNAAPIEVADFLRKRLFESDTSVVLTSATLSTESGSAAAGSHGRPGEAKGDRGLSYFVQRVGAESARQLQVGSPFDYQKQMKLVVVSKMPDPQEKGFREALVHWIRHYLKETQGKAFVLFTNFKLMRELAESMELFFEEQGLDCFVQGTGTPRSTMLEKFKQDTNSVLFGTDSFWQGVDVPGESLSNVIITRLPFAVPDHPLVEARMEAIEAKGGNSFMELSLPEAILKLRQGVGRLIRTRSDKGIVVVLDNRILVKRYGRLFLNALPKCSVEVV